MRRRQEGPGVHVQRRRADRRAVEAVVHAGHWYLSGFDRLARINALPRRSHRGRRLAQRSAEAPVGDVNEPSICAAGNSATAQLVEATILVDADQAAYARHILGDVVDHPTGRSRPRSTSATSMRFARSCCRSSNMRRFSNPLISARLRRVAGGPAMSARLNARDRLARSCR